MLSITNNNSYKTFPKISYTVSKYCVCLYASGFKLLLVVSS